jgi:hypothetical protein
MRPIKKELEDPETGHIDDCEDSHCDAGKYENGLYETRSHRIEQSTGSIIKANVILEGNRHSQSP